MKYVQASKPSLISTWLKRLWANSTAPAKPVRYPTFEERIDYGQERVVPSKSAFHQISSTRGWWTSRATQ